MYTGDLDTRGIFRSDFRATQPWTAREPYQRGNADAYQTLHMYGEPNKQTFG